MDTLILYHLSPELNHDGSFVPRVPKNRSNEDDIIPRICFSSTLEGCYRSAFWGIGGRGNLERLALFTLDLSKTPVRYQRPEEIKIKVNDAVENNEHWVLDPVRDLPKTIIRLKSKPNLDDYNDPNFRLDYMIDAPAVDPRSPFAHLSDEDLEKAWNEYQSFGNGACWHPGIINGIIQEMKRDYGLVTIGMKREIPALIMHEMIKRYRKRLGFTE